MARFRIKKDNLPGLVWLVDFAFVGSRRESCLAVEQACELRDLLNKEFPVEPANAQWAAAYNRMCRERDDALIQVDQLTAQVLDLQREQQPTPQTPIAQVVEACGAPSGWSIRFGESRKPAASGKEFFAVVEGSDEFYVVAAADTPEAALSKLYTDAVERLRQQRDEVQDKLTKLGVEL